ncbi:hypothetical protein G6F70_000696 [Rhizopus microsporus]|uniref:CSN8/PSMD8/EIF3K domain-containing protein n=1 Tax=Rhizopus microsporus TaxID=58291 RepID=A0A1X0S3B9_RHIZD|nr:hypothetical protein G6F71_001032 [Rhizopus microsporus]KAG1204206.1 hypothetical protein G6F70_000696 [Rhizopus microsporus]KAG1215435.1 hypothetical protein G6F69_001033 [Rhizopus microsporus]KAG1238230.1 hypothetical protein G6F67_000597 [Rhizopus microsporus]KAG1269257.1 hypothetical protein G6F68_000417 [Rhizopus microsporus]
MDPIAVLINEQKYADLFEYCQQLEIQSVTNVNVDLQVVYPIYLASSVFINDFQAARYIRKRIKKRNINTEQIEAIWRVIAALINKSYPEAYKQMDSFGWTEWMQILVSRIKEKLRNEMLSLIPKVYSSIDLSQVSNLFGVQGNELITELTNRGWKCEGNMVYPIKQVSISAPKLTNENQYSRLADILIQLEKF